MHKNDVCGHTRGGQKSALGILPQEPFTLFCEIDGLSHWPGALQISWADWPASPRILLVSASPVQGYRRVLSHTAFESEF